MPVRIAIFLGLWICLIGPAPQHLPAGLVAALVAGAASRRLWPDHARLSPAGLIGFCLRFLPQAVMAGLDVGARAMAPRIALRPGFTDYRTSLSPGMARAAFRAVSSLQPGTLPVGETVGDVIRIHCLDVAAPVAASLGADEAAFRRILREAAHA